jgi:hypothetical protein
MGIAGFAAAAFAPVVVTAIDILWGVAGLEEGLGAGLCRRGVWRGGLVNQNK